MGATGWEKPGMGVSAGSDKAHWTIRRTSEFEGKFQSKGAPYSREITIRSDKAHWTIRRTSEFEGKFQSKGTPYSREITIRNKIKNFIEVQFLLSISMLAEESFVVEEMPLGSSQSISLNHWMDFILLKIDLNTFVNVIQAGIAVIKNDLRFQVVDEEESAKLKLFLIFHALVTVLKLSHNLMYVLKDCKIKSEEEYLCFQGDKSSPDYKNEKYYTVTKQ
ncbi:hypothetical protein TURU_103895 [Turdus rufiventris]|nr:hypothetical protein TURU_103895 [Turdus rufiventris]